MAITITSKGVLNKTDETSKRENILIIRPVMNSQYVEKMIPSNPPIHLLVSLSPYSITVSSGKRSPRLIMRSNKIMEIRPPISTESQAPVPQRQ